MAKVTLTANLKQYFPEGSVEVEGQTLVDILNAMEAQKPHFKSYVLDEHDHIRKHVNIFIDGKMVKDKENTSLEIQESTQIHIMQALSGG